MLLLEFRLGGAFIEGRETIRLAIQGASAGSSRPKFAAAGYPEPCTASIFAEFVFEFAVEHVKFGSALVFDFLEIGARIPADHASHIEIGVLSVQQFLAFSRPTSRFPSYGVGVYCDMSPIQARN